MNAKTHFENMIKNNNKSSTSTEEIMRRVMKVSPEDRMRAIAHAIEHYCGITVSQTGFVHNVYTLIRVEGYTTDDAIIEAINNAFSKRTKLGAFGKGK